MKYLTIGLVVLVLSGCGAMDRVGAYWTGNASKTCFEGVLYLQFTSGASVAYNKNGSVKGC